MRRVRWLSGPSISRAVEDSRRRQARPSGKLRGRAKNGKESLRVDSGLGGHRLRLQKQGKGKRHDGAGGGVAASHVGWVGYAGGHLITPGPFGAVGIMFVLAGGPSTTEQQRARTGWLRVVRRLLGQTAMDRSRTRGITAARSYGCDGARQFAHPSREAGTAWPATTSFLAPCLGGCSLTPMTIRVMASGGAESKARGGKASRRRVLVTRNSVWLDPSRGHNVSSISCFFFKLIPRDQDELGRFRRCQSFLARRWHRRNAPDSASEDVDGGSISFPTCRRRHARHQKVKAPESQIGCGGQDWAAEAGRRTSKQVGSKLTKKLVLARGSSKDRRASGMDAVARLSAADTRLGEASRKQ